MKTKVFFDRISATENEWSVAAFAVELLQAKARADPTALPRGLRPRDVRTCQGNTESTYVIRLFAEFETALRAFWRRVRNVRTWPRTHVRTLIDNIAARCHIASDPWSQVHRVREYRNRLVHQAGRAPATTFRQCRSCLCRFLSFLPPTF